MDHDMRVSFAVLFRPLVAEIPLAGIMSSRSDAGCADDLARSEKPTGEAARRPL